MEYTLDGDHLLHRCVSLLNGINHTHLSAVMKHIDRIYASQGSWLFAPPKLDWEEQIVLITGGELVVFITKNFSADGQVGAGSVPYSRRLWRFGM